MVTLLNSSTKNDFRGKILSEFQSRKSINPKYSLRAFSRDLDIDPSYLSKLLKGQRAFTLALEHHFSRTLRWPIKTSSSQKLARMKDSYRTLDLDSFILISEWHHYAIFELIKIKGTDWGKETIAFSLGVSEEKAYDAISRLIRLGLIRRKGNSFVRTSKGITTLGNNFTTSAFRALQREILCRAVSAMETIPMEFRDQTSMTLAIPSSQIPKAKKMLTKFRRRFCAEMQKEGKLDTVYQLSLSFYPVTPKIEPRRAI